MIIIINLQLKTFIVKEYFTKIIYRGEKKGKVNHSFPYAIIMGYYYGELLRGIWGKNYHVSTTFSLQLYNVGDTCLKLKEFCGIVQIAKLSRAFEVLSGENKKGIDPPAVLFNT